MLAALLLALAVHAADSPAPLALEPLFDTVSFNYGTPLFSPDGKAIAFPGASDASVWDIESGSQKARLAWRQETCGHETYCGGALLALSPGGRQAVLLASKTRYIGKDSGVPNGAIDYRRWRMEGEYTLSLWDVAAEKKLRDLHSFRARGYQTGSRFQPFQVLNPTVFFSPDGKRIAIFEDLGGPEWKEPHGAGFVADAETGKLRALGAVRPWFDASGRLLSAAVRPGTGELRDEDAGTRLGYLQDFGGVSDIFELSGDGSAVAILFRQDGYRKLQVWSTRGGKLLYDRRWSPANGDAERAIRLDAAGRRLIDIPIDYSGKPATADVYALGGSSVPRTAALATSAAYYLAFSSDGAYAVGPRAVDGNQKYAVFRVSWDAAPAPAAAPVAAKPAGPALDVDAPLPAKTPADPDAYAVVVGIEKYRQAGLPGVDYAARDAATMRDYLVGAMGFDEANVALLTDEQATKTDLEKHLGPWLANRVTAKSRVFVYYAGHGAPNPATGKGFLVPYEGDPNYTDVTGFPLQALYDALGRLPAKDVTVVLDACFSGSGGRSLLAKGARPLVNAVKASAAGNTTVLAAASGAQVSASYPEGRHGLLSYFLFEGLQGAADADKDGAITTAELFAHARARVEREARKQNLEQTPQLNGAGSAVWLRR